MTTFKFIDSVIRAGAGEKSFSRGQELYLNGAISNATIQGNTLMGHCEGAQSPFYKVRAELDSGGIRSASCNCDYNFGGYCKHIVALMLTYAHKPELFAVRKDPTELLADLDREQLVALLAKLMRERPELYDTVEAAMALSKTGPSATSKRKTPASRRKKVDVEPYRRHVRGIMHSLDRMRASEAYWHVGGLTDELRGVEKTAMEFLDAGDAETALRILLTLLEESYDGFNYIDDSDGYLGDYLSGLGETLAEVILSLDPDEEQREEILKELEKIDRALSDYGVEGLEVAITAAQQGWDEWPQDAKDRIAEREDDREWDNEDDEESLLSSGYGSRRPESPSQVLTRAKLNVLERQGRTDEYLALCLQSGSHLRYALKLAALDRVPEVMKYALKHLAGAGDALKLAQYLREAGHLDESLKIGECGLKLGGSKAALGEWLGPIEETQERTAQALEAWEAAFHDSPSLATWQTIKRLAGSRWKRLKPGLMASLEKGYNDQPLVEVLLEEQDWDAAIKVADRKGQYYRVVATVADGMIQHRPEWVIRASIKQAEDLIAPAKSKYYSHAAEWLRRAKAAYTQVGQTNEWQKYLLKLRDQYKRRPALMAQLERL
ncbi:MAG: SWIM zinc finger family protein [Acidobacteria bacterium]|nr:SWIM zinc finger family protein [Acidobacteriota bacterium]